MTYEARSKWDVKEILSGDVSVDAFLKKLLEVRGYIADEDIKSFLSPELSNIPPYTNLFDSKSAAKKILEAIEEKKKIFVYGDYDVDGIVSTCILWTFLYRELGADVLPYIPDRVQEGYGLSRTSLDNLVFKEAQMIITVDCGVRDKELIKEYSEKYGIEFIITDHHLPPDEILDGLTYTLVHPLYPGHEYPYPNVCGAYVAFLLVQAIKAVKGFDYILNEATPFLELVALASVTDIMPLVGVNRSIVKYGLQQLRQSKNIGLKQLANFAKLDLAGVSAYHLGYILGPRLNASGRIDSAMSGLKLLATSNMDTAVSLASKLNELNMKRQDITKEILEYARKSVDASKKLIFIAGEGWPEGIIGLVAGKLQEEFFKPVIVLTTNGDEIRGSARSVTGFNITDAIASSSEYLEKYGGHSQAAGLTVKKGELENFKNSVMKYVEENLDSELLKRSLDIDLQISTSWLTMDIVRSLEALEPYGYGNKKPVFLLSDVVVVSKRVLGKDMNHMKLEIQGDYAGVDEAILFNCAEDIEKIKVDDRLDLVGSLGVNEWNNLSKVQFEIKEWRKALA